MSQPVTKSYLREQFRARRHALSKTERDTHALQLLAAFLTEEKLHVLSPAAGYVATHHEADPAPIIEHMFSKKIKIGLPKTTDEKELIFCQWKKGDVLHEGKFGIPEPGYTGQLIPKLTLVPLVAYDAEGFRLGYGGGYYDRTLSKPAYQQSILLGVAYAFQRTESLPRETHDVRLHGVITEKGVEWFR